MIEKTTSQQQAARRIRALLAQAEDAAKRGNEQERAAAMEKAGELQFKYALDAAHVAHTNEDEIIWKMFCQERKAPLVRARRELMAWCSDFFDGTAVQLGVDAVQVFAHESVMEQITALYDSLLLQMYGMMAEDQKHAALTPGWKLAYARNWVGRVGTRLRALKNAHTTASEPGTAVVLVGRSEATRAALDNTYGGRISKASTYSKSNSNRGGANAGWEAGGRADLGQTKISKS